MSYIVAHGDLDGLAAAAIIMSALRRRGEPVRLEIARPYTLAATLTRLIPLRPHRIVVVDLGIDSATWPSLSLALSAHASQGCKILWVDHHPTTLRFAAELAELGVALLHSSCGSASTVARDAFAHQTDDPAFYARLARLGEISDGAAEDGGELGLVAEAISAAISAPASGEELKRRLVKMWVEEKRLVSDDIAVLAEEFDRAVAEKVREVRGRVVLEVEGGMVIDARGLRLSGLAGHVASRLARAEGKAVVLLFSPEEQTVVATCRVPSNVDFDALGELLPIALELGGGGGGHARAAALRVPAAVGDAFLVKVLDVVRKLGRGAKRGGGGP